MSPGGDMTAGRKAMGKTLRILFAVGVLTGLGGSGCAAAAEPSGCDKFKWPIAHEQAALAAPAAGPLAPGATLPADVGARLKLVPFAEAKLALAPERPPKFSPSYAGAFGLDAPAAPAVYKVTLSAGGWIDVVQGGKFLKPIDFSGALDCANARKSVKFRLAAEPTTLQLTGLGDPDLSIIVSPE
jgi:hypothetical protein